MLPAQLVKGHVKYTIDSHQDLCLCFTSPQQRGYLETAPPFTVPCEGRAAR